ncbi:MAG TPA: PQQ-binding-like beta-propeller repeat protein [Humisphaera sp.]|jgi:outer membrane protein assembly factor BamB|nr:PQQ-binding-like beta-propeller repeat protein [Humisphaera sp.]
MTVFHRCGRETARPKASFIELAMAGFLISLSASSRLFAQTKPADLPKDWPAFHAGGALRGVAQPIGAPPMKLRWTFRTSENLPATAPSSTQPAPQAGRFEGSAAISNGTVYIADTAGLLHAIDLKTGKRKWVYPAIDGEGFETTPLVMDGKVFIGDLGGIFHAVAASDGHKLWTFDSASTIHSSANAIGNRIVFGDDGADIFCIDANTGAKLWEEKAGDRVNGAPAIVDGAALVSGCDAQLRGIGLADGKEMYAVDLGALCPGSAAISNNRIVMGTDGGRVVCLTADKRQQAWLFESVENRAMVYSSPAIADGIVVVGARDRNVYGLELSSGKKIWSFPTRGEVDSSPAISGGRVYVGSKDRKLYVLDLKTGAKIWEFSASRAITGSPAIAEGVAVVGDTSGTLYCLEPEK